MILLRSLRFTSLVIFFLLVRFSFAQTDSISCNSGNVKKSWNAYGFGLIPSSATNIYGIAIGLFGSDALCHSPYTKYSHGINVQIIGQGFVNTFYINKVEFSNLFLQETYNDSLVINNSTWRRAVNNGLLFSTFGTWTDKINGIAFSFWMSAGSKVNGLSFNLLWNLYHQINGLAIAAYNHTTTTKGVQIGLMNITKELIGFQIGFWNKNGKRSFPIINWSFKK